MASILPPMPLECLPKRYRPFVLALLLLARTIASNKPAHRRMITSRSVHQRIFAHGSIDWRSSQEDPPAMPGQSFTREIIYQDHD